MGSSVVRTRARARKKGGRGVGPSLPSIAIGRQTAAEPTIYLPPLSHLRPARQLRGWSDSPPHAPARLNSPTSHNPRDHWPAAG